VISGGSMAPVRHIFTSDFKVKLKLRKQLKTLNMSKWNRQCKCAFSCVSKIRRENVCAVEM